MRLQILFGMTGILLVGTGMRVALGAEQIQVEWQTPSLEELAEFKKQAFDDTDFAKAKPHILPQLAPREIFTEKQLQFFVHANFLHGLVVYYMVEHPEVQMPPGMSGHGRQLNSYIHLEELTQWKITERELFRVAMENINAYERNQTYREVTSAPGKMFVMTTDDGFAAARLLSMGLLRVWAKEMQDDLVIAIPTKDVLYATSRSNEAGITYLKKLSTEQFHKQERNLTDHLLVFQVTDGTISEFPEGTPRHSSGKRYVFLPNGPIHGGPVKDLRKTNR
ncbi:MAG: DUF1444 family protein [Deltaproteobacteria bacterium]|nr:DUF1444 family protein [Deltaproteobacteria bacterium]